VELDAISAASLAEAVLCPLTAVFTARVSVLALVVLSLLLVAAWASALTSRWVAVPARGDGLGAGLYVSAGPLALAAVVAAAIAAAAAAGPARGGLALGLAVALGAASAWSARRTVGGRTGDTLGAAVALAEVGLCLALLASWH
jgi:adenosylcobinamide-GDP ribazoletransferase